MCIEKMNDGHQLLQYIHVYMIGRYVGIHNINMQKLYTYTCKFAWNYSHNTSRTLLAS